MAIPKEGSQLSLSLHPAEDCYIVTLFRITRNPTVGIMAVSSSQMRLEVQKLVADPSFYARSRKQSGRYQDVFQKNIE